MFNPVTVAPEAAAPSSASLPLSERTGPGSPEAAGVIEIEFATGGRMRLSGSVAASTVSVLMKVLAKGKRR